MELRSSSWVGERTAALVAISGTAASAHLDMARGAAALLVLFQHTRLLLFPSYESISPHRPPLTAAYFLCNFGHSAVMIFFVLSGFFISSSVIRATASGRWSWTDYLLRRLTRLYVVLIPALISTVAWDRLGRYVLDGRTVFASETARAIIDPATVVRHSGLDTFLGNLAFLQHILCPPFGSDTAFWSLSCEFWYYVLFPCLWLGLVKPGSKAELLLFVSAFAFLGCLCPDLAFYFPIWLLGSLIGLARVPRIGSRRDWAPAAQLVAALGACPSIRLQST